MGNGTTVSGPETMIRVEGTDAELVLGQGSNVASSNDVFLVQISNGATLVLDGSTVADKTYIHLVNSSSATNLPVIAFRQTLTANLCLGCFLKVESRQSEILIAQGDGYILTETDLNYLKLHTDSEIGLSGGEREEISKYELYLDKADNQIRLRQKAAPSASGKL